MTLQKLMEIYDLHDGGTQKMTKENGNCIIEFDLGEVGNEDLYDEMLGGFSKGERKKKKVVVTAIFHNARQYIATRGDDPCAVSRVWEDGSGVNAMVLLHVSSDVQDDHEKITICWEDWNEMMCYFLSFIFDDVTIDGIKVDDIEGF